MNTIDLSIKAPPLRLGVASPDLWVKAAPVKSWTELSPPRIVFYLEGREVGALVLKDGRLHFEGDLDASAEQLLAYVCHVFNARTE